MSTTTANPSSTSSPPTTSTTDVAGRIQHQQRQEPEGENEEEDEGEEDEDELDPRVEVWNKLFNDLAFPGYLAYYNMKCMHVCN